MLTVNRKLSELTTTFIRLCSSGVSVSADSAITWSDGLKQYPAIRHRDTDLWYKRRATEKNLPRRIAEPSDYVDIKHRNFHFPYIRPDGGMQYFRFVYYPR